MARASRNRTQGRGDAAPQAPAAPPAHAAGDDPGLADLLAQRDAVYRQNAEAQKVMDEVEAKNRAARASAAGTGTTPAAAPATGDDPGLSGLLAHRDQVYRETATAQQAMNEAAQRQTGVGSIYRTAQFPEPSTPLPAAGSAAPATPEVGDAAARTGATAEQIETPQTSARRARVRRGG